MLNIVPPNMPNKTSITMKAIIVDDELNARLALRGILEENFPNVSILAESKDVPSAVTAIHQYKPDLVN